MQCKEEPNVHPVWGMFQPNPPNPARLKHWCPPCPRAPESRQSQSTSTRTPGDPAGPARWTTREEMGTEKSLLRLFGAGGGGRTGLPGMREDGCSSSRLYRSPSSAASRTPAHISWQHRAALGFLLPSSHSLLSPVGIVGSGWRDSSSHSLFHTRLLDPPSPRFSVSRAAAEPRAVQGQRTTAPLPGCPRQGWRGRMMLGDAMERWARRMPAKDARNEGPAPRVCTGWLSPMGGERGAHTHTRLSETARLKGLKLATSLSPQRLKRSLHISCSVVFHAAAVGEHQVL